MHTFPSLLPSSLFTNQNSNYVLVPSPLPSFILVTSGFFLQESKSHLPLGPSVITLAPFRIFHKKDAKIFAAQGAPPVSLTPAAN
jgi:hypothetical protein